MTNAQAIHPVILSGGAGTRLWPVSRHLKPKQFQPIASPVSLLAETIERLNDPRFLSPTVVCSEDHRFLVAEEFRAANKPAAAIILEPEPRNTAPAIAAAAFHLSRSQPDVLLAVFPSDHVIGDLASFYKAIDSATKAALSGQLVTFGITPNRPNTGYGYIQEGPAFADIARVHTVRRFVEKPDLQTATAYLQEGSYTWNSGMFMFRACDFLQELKILAPEIYEHSRLATDQMIEENGFLKLDATAFAGAPSTSMDYAVMEKTHRAVVVAADFGWNDVGSWASLHEIGTPDQQGNVTTGDVVLYQAKNSYVRSDKQLIAAVGIENLVVVATDDAVLVAPLDRDQDVRGAVEVLKQQGRAEAIAHSRVFRPWGSYQNLLVDSDYLVKEIIVNAGAKLSLQYHNHRAEHWVVVEGRARVTNGEKNFDLTVDQSTYIPVGVTHRLENQGTTPLRMMEVQVGPVISEEDIVRVEDDFGRT